MTYGTRRRMAAAVFAAATLLLGACEGEGDVTQDPQGPAENAPGTQGPQASPTTDE